MVLTKSAFSPFETVWKSLPHGKTVRTHKIFVRDAQNFFDYSQWKYEGVSIELPYSDDLPPEQWIQKEFFNAILGTPEGRRDLVLTVPMNTTFESVTVESLNLEEIVRNMEDCILHLELIHGLRTAEGDVATKLLEILCHREIGDRNSIYVQKTDIQNAVNNAVVNEQPLRIILPAFPFKDQNPFRTEARASHTDLGEIIMIARLYTLISCFMEVLPSIGVELIICCDGLIYSDIFCIDRAEVIAYRERIRSYRNILNLQQLVHLIDVADMVRDFDSFNEVLCTVENYLKKEIDKNIDMKNQFLILTRGIKFNLNLRHFVNKHGLMFIGRCLDETVGDDELSSDELTVREEIDLLARNAALKYISLHLTMKYCNVFGKLFPGALRATVHPKQGQIGIAKGGSVFPWNGVPLVSKIEEENLWRKTEIVEISRIYYQAREKIIQRVYLEGESDPFCYKIAEK